MDALLTLVPTQKETRVLLTRGKDTLLKGRLPPLKAVRHERAATALMEALSLWVDERLCVALYAGELESCFRFGLADELGVGARSVFYAVELVGRRRRGEPARDERQLALVPPREGGAR